MDKDLHFKKKKAWLEELNLKQEGKKLVKDVSKKDEHKMEEEDVKRKDIKDQFDIKTKKKAWKFEVEEYGLPKVYKTEIFTPTAARGQKPIDSTSAKESQYVEAVSPINVPNKLTQTKLDLLEHPQISTRDEAKDTQLSVGEFTTSPIEVTSQPQIVSEDLNVQQTVTSETEETQDTLDYKSLKKQADLDQDVATDLAEEKPEADESVVSSRKKTNQDVSKDIVDNEAVVDISNKQKPEIKALLPETEIEPGFKESKKRHRQKSSYYEARYKDSEQEEEKLREYLRIKPKTPSNYTDFYEKKKKKF